MSKIVEFIILGGIGLAISLLKKQVFKGVSMPHLTVGYENSTEIKLYYNDIGSGEPLIFIHGYPFSAQAWEKEISYFVEKGFRVISYDRRGFGYSSKPSLGYDWDTFAEDLNQLISGLDLNDVTLIGHSMGTGEITRYLSKYGSRRILRSVLVSPIPPYLLKTEDNPEGVEQEVFNEFKKSVKEDRYSFIADFIEKFYGLGKILGGASLSQEKISSDFQIAAMSSPIAMYKCIDTWTENLNWDLKGFDEVPTLIIQGDADKILPLEVTGKILADKIEARLRVLNGGSHGIPWTHSEEICECIEDFIKETDQFFERQNTVLEYSGIQ